jgi:hypothetical protein
MRAGRWWCGGFGIFHDHILPFFYALNVSKLPPYFTAASVPNPPFPTGICSCKEETSADPDGAGGQ